MNKLEFTEFLGLVRAWSLFMTPAASLIGIGYANYLGLIHNYLEVLYFVLAVLGALLLHMSVNVLNDYYDVIQGVDSMESPTARYRPHPILTGKVSLPTARALGFSLMGLGVVIGIYLVLIEGLWILIFGLLGVFLLYAYTGPPFTLKYRGLGEISVALTWGPLLIGGFFVATSMGILKPAILLVSIPPMLIMFAIIYANNYRDRNFDSRAGVKSLAVLTGRYGYGIYVASLITAFIITVILTAAKITPFTSLIAIATAPMVPGLIKDFRANKYDIDARTGRLYTIFCILYGVGMIINSLI